MNECKVVFIGGLTNGKIVLDYLMANRHVSIPLVITHPVGASVPRYVDFSRDVGNIPIIHDLDAETSIDQQPYNIPDDHPLNQNSQISISRRIECVNIY